MCTFPSYIMLFLLRFSLLYYFSGSCTALRRFIPPGIINVHLIIFFLPALSFSFLFTSHILCMCAFQCLSTGILRTCENHLFFPHYWVHQKSINEIYTHFWTRGKPPCQVLGKYNVALSDFDSYIHSGEITVKSLVMDYLFMESAIKSRVIFS